MSVRVNGVVPTPRASTDRPGGIELIVTVDTFGKIDTVWLVCKPAGVGDRHRQLEVRRELVGRGR